MQTFVGKKIQIQTHVSTDCMLGPLLQRTRIKEGTTFDS